MIDLNTNYKDEHILKCKDGEILRNNLHIQIENHKEEAESSIFANKELNKLNKFNKFQNQNKKCRTKYLQNISNTKENQAFSPLSQTAAVYNIEKDLLSISQSQQINRDSQYQLFENRDYLRKDHDDLKMDKQNLIGIKPNSLISQSINENQYQKEGQQQLIESGISNSEIQQAKRFSIKKGIEFLVIKNIKKFILNIKKKSRSLLFKALTKPQFLLINDVSSNYDYYLESAYFNLSVNQNLLEIIKNCFFFINRKEVLYKTCFIKQEVKYIFFLFLIQQQMNNDQR